jgi:TRAP-type transport system small permease protein
MEMTQMPTVPPPALADPAERATAARHALFTRLGRGLDRLLGLVLCAVVLLNFVSAASRYVFGRAILGADEVQVYAVVWLVFVGGARVAWRRSHLRMDVLSARLQGRTARVREVLEDLLAVAVCGVMSWVSLQFVLQMHGMGQRSDGAGIPMWLAHAAVLGGFALMTLAAGFALVQSLRVPQH